MARAEIVGDAIHAVVDIGASPDLVFRALTDPEQLSAWWGAEGNYRTHAWELDLRQGGRWGCNAVNTATGAETRVEGEVLEVDPPRTLSYTWNASWAPIPETVVRYELVATEAGTRLSLTHSGFGVHSREMQDHTEGWSRVLAWLQAYASGRAV